MRTLAALLAPGGVALLATDLTSSELHPPLIHAGTDVDLSRLMADLIAAGSFIYAAHPGQLTSEMRRDPTLKQAFAVRFPIGPWIWRNGPTQALLVYGIEIRRKTSSA